MHNSPFFRRLFVPNLLLICAATILVGFLAAKTLRSSFLDRQIDALRDDVRLVSHSIKPALVGPPPADFNEQIRKLGKVLGARITIMREDGLVVADSVADIKTIENHKARPEFSDAMNKGEGITDRTSGTTHENLLYLAQPVKDLDGQLVRDPSGQAYYARVATDFDQLRGNISVLYVALIIAGLVAVMATGAVSYYFARRQAAPMIEVTQFARDLSMGQLNRRAGPFQTDEYTHLARSLNTMADSLSRLISQTNKDKAELLTILASMSEGVIATDTNQKILLVNDAAAKLLQFDATNATGKHLWAVVRNEQILKSSAEVLTSSQRKMLSIGPVSARHLDVTLCTFPADSTAQGLIIVAHDITQSFQYQELRKEFVANVSHELRTPLTVIKGFVETLLDGAWRDEAKPPEYLNTIHRHTNQLSNLVSDLLELSKIESQGLTPRRSMLDLGAVIRKAGEFLAPATQKKSQALDIEIDPAIGLIKGNGDYIERAVSNLIDNASKYSPEHGRILVKAHTTNGSAIIEVSDNGIGIPAEDIPRIFERFYRVDRSRSREMGGTGLGLSIVKHVAQVHGGTIDVESMPGKGTTFRLKIPTT